MVLSTVPREREREREREVMIFIVWYVTSWHHAHLYIILIQYSTLVKVCTTCTCQEQDMNSFGSDTQACFFCSNAVS